MSRPANIIFVMADQTRRAGLAASRPPAGQSAERIERPGRARGVVFDAAYCNSPLCAPSRFSMLSGRLPSEIGAYDNAAEFPATCPDLRPYAAARRATARSSRARCTSVGPDQLHGFEERLTTDIYPADFGWTRGLGAGRRSGWTSITPCSASCRGRGPASAASSSTSTRRWPTRRSASIFDLARDQRRPAVLPAGFLHPSPRPLHHRPGVLGPLPAEDEIDLPSVPALVPEEMDPHSRRLHAGSGPGRLRPDRRAHPQGPPGLLRRDLLRRRQARAPARQPRWRRAGLAEDSVWSSSPPTTATCWAKGGSGTR